MVRTLFKGTFLRKIPIMKNIIYLLFFSLISFQSIYAQKIIEGTIIDGEFGGALPFASVVLYVQEGDNEIKIGGVSSDFDGKFVFEDLNDGIYLCKFLPGRPSGSEKALSNWKS